MFTCNSINRLKRNKDEGSIGCKCDHLINFGKRLLLFLLFKAILYHGYSPPELITFTIVLVPKDVKESLSHYETVATTGQFLSSMQFQKFMALLLLIFIW